MARWSMGRLSAVVTARLVLFALIIWSPPALSQPRPRARAGAEPDVDEEAKTKAMAKAFAEAGAAHFDKGEYREALEEFRRSLELRKNRTVMLNIARSLQLLGQYDEAMEQCEEIEQLFKETPASFQSKVADTVTELEALMGTLTLSGDVPEGASLFIDNRLRGKLPLSTPLRLSKGVRQIRVEKEGFEPIATSTEVSAGKEATAKLAAKSRKGRLRVIEKHGWPLRVEIDGKDTGALTPWEGQVEVGEHRVRLYGLLDAEAFISCDVEGNRTRERASTEGKGAKMESGVEVVRVGLYEVKVVPLGADATDASLKVESAPVGARLWLDGRDSGKTPWEGRLPLGAHTIEVKADGYIGAKQEVTLERRKQKEITVALDRAFLSVDSQKRIGWSAAVAGSLGLAVGAVTGGAALDQAGRIRQRCEGPQCPTGESANIAMVRDLSTASTVGFVVGGVGAAAGTLLLLTLPSNKPERERGSQGVGAPQGGGAAWTVGAGAGRIELRGSF